VAGTFEKKLGSRQLLNGRICWDIFLKGTSGTRTRAFRLYDWLSVNGRCDLDRFGRCRIPLRLLLRWGERAPYLECCDRHRPSVSIVRQSASSVSRHRSAVGIVPRSASFLGRHRSSVGIVRQLASSLSSIVRQSASSLSQHRPAVGIVPRSASFLGRHRPSVGMVPRSAWSPGWHRPWVGIVPRSASSRGAAEPRRSNNQPSPQWLAPWQTILCLPG